MRAILNPLPELQPYRGLLEAAPDAMVITSPEGWIVLVNARLESLFGYSRREILGRKVEMLFLQPPGANDVSPHGRRSDGTEFPAEIRQSPLETESGPFAITAIRDASERLRAEEAIRVRDEILSVASHELKTPLQALRLQVEGVMRAARGPASGQVVARAARIGRAIRRVNDLIDQLLDLSRITAGRLDLERHDVDLCALVRDVLDQFQDEITHAHTTVAFRPQQPAIRGSWDPLRIEQVVTNLVSNALKYGGGRPVELSAGVGGATAFLTVRDHGIGIAPEDQHRIFDRFERVVPHRQTGGFGLGLWIVRHILEAHGGTIRVSSRPGDGSTFTVELPLA